MKILAKFHNQDNPYCVDLFVWLEEIYGGGCIYIGEMYGYVDIGRSAGGHWHLAIRDKATSHKFVVFADLIQKGD